MGMNLFRIILLFLFVFLNFSIFSQTAEEFVKSGIEKAKVGEHKAAIELFDKAIKLKPDEFIYYQYRAYAKDALKDYKGSIADYDKAITLSPGNTELYYNRALTKYSSGDKKAACADWQLCVDMGMKEALFIIQLYCN